MKPVARVVRVVQYGAGTEHVRSRYGAGTEHVRSGYGACTEQVRSKYGVGTMQVLITIIQYHEIL